MARFEMGEADVASMGATGNPEIIDGTGPDVCNRQSRRSRSGGSSQMV